MIVTENVSVTDDYVLRGGGYDSGAEALRTTNRASERAPEFRLVPNVGFRLDWLLDIISFRKARVPGPWGHPPD